MKKSIYKYLQLTLVLAVGIGIGWFIFGGGQSESAGETAESQASQEIWTCSMHPQIRQPEAGDCPICGMDLIPLKEEVEGTDQVSIKMSEVAMQLADVQTAIVAKEKPTKHISLNGKLAIDERLQFTQSSHIPGRVEKLMVDFTGDFVKKGQEIAVIYSPELITAQEELFQAQKLGETQPLLFEASIEKLKNWRLTDDQIEMIMDSGTPIERFPIRADVSGYVTNKLINLGDYLSEGQPIYEVSDLSRLWVLFDVYESDLAWVQKGDEVEYRVQTLGDKAFQGKISYLDPVINPRTRIARARLIFNNPDQRLKPEMFVSGHLKTNIGGGKEQIIAPRSAILWTGKRSIVYVTVSGGKESPFQMREVELGPSLGDAYVISEGLKEGEEIAVNGAFSIDAAAQLSGKPSMMNPQGGSKSNEHNHGQKDHKHTTSDLNSNAASKRIIEPVLAPYLGMKDALADDDFGIALQAARKLASTINAIQEGELNQEEVAVWQQQKIALSKELEHLDHISSIEELRQSFNGISNAVILLAESFHLGNGSYYIQHCPMANSNTGADWISKEQEIFNPYFGASMLKCGEVSRTIK